MIKSITAFLLLTSTVFAADINEICKKGLKVYEANEKLNKESNSVTQDLNSKKNSLYSSQRTLKKGFGSEEVSRLEKDMTDLKKSIADYEGYLKNYKIKLKAKEDLMAMSKLSKEQQAAKLKEIDEELKTIREKVNSLSKPFRDKRSANERSLSAEEKDFEAFMKKQFTTSKKLGIDTVEVSPGLASAFSSVTWKKGNNRVLWAHIRMRPLPEKNNSPLLFDKYIASTISDNSIWYWAGHFQIAFVSSDPSFKNKEKLKEAVKELIQSETLSAVKAQ